MKHIVYNIQRSIFDIFKDSQMHSLMLNTLESP
jgi:hypothetical protein